MAAGPSLGTVEVARAMGADLATPGGDRRFERVSIDTRTMAAGDLFFAVRGPRFDGHAFVAEAVAKGASGLVVSDAAAARMLPAPLPVFVVRDTVAALQALARDVRGRSKARVVAITGSAGKTTTKELTAALLEGTFRTLRNRGNLNNHIGLPLSLMELTQGADVAVMELGMNHAGEIRQLVSIASPDVRVWTNVGTAHLEFFGTPEAIADAKAEILDDAGPDATFVANADDPRVIARAAGFPGVVVSFGLDPSADVHGTVLEDAGFEGMAVQLRTRAGTWSMNTPLAGVGNLRNALAATAVALQFGITPAEIASRLEGAAPAAHRGEVKRLRDGVRVVDDSYNSSPTALQLLLEVARRDPAARRRVAFLGEMLELGDASPRLHAECGRAVANAGVAALVTVGGPAARALGEAAREAGVAAAAVAHADTSEEAAGLVGSVVRPGDLVLVKGSRGTRMERVVERLEAEFA